MLQQRRKKDWRESRFSAKEENQMKTDIGTNYHCEECANTQPQLHNHNNALLCDECYELETSGSKKDKINPSHYKAYPVEIITITECMNFNRGNAVKYITRAGLKDSEEEITDLKKAVWYLNREIDRITNR